jgi:hypothetical protein
MPRWRNGRRGGLKIRFPLGSVGSSPSLGTILLRSTYYIPCFSFTLWISTFVAIIIFAAYVVLPEKQIHIN